MLPADCVQQVYVCHLVRQREGKRCSPEQNVVASVGCILTGFPVIAFSFWYLSNCFYLCKTSRCKALPFSSETLLFPLDPCFAHLCEMAHLLHCLRYPRIRVSCIYSCNRENSKGRKKTFVLFVDQKALQTWVARQKIDFFKA